jgi:hypothetical protein
LQSAQAGNTDISAAYAKAATEAYKMANDISLLAIKHNEPAADTTQIKNYEYGLAHPGFNQPPVAPRPVTADECATWGLPDTGAFTIAPGEAPKPITGAGAQGEPLDQGSIDYLAARLAKGDNTALTGLGFSKVGAENRARGRCHVVESLMWVRRVSQLKSCGGDDFAPRLHG